MKRIMAWMATAATLTFALPGATPGTAGQRDPRLDDLFARLHGAPSSAAAEVVEQGIWRLWTASGDPAIDRLMVRGMFHMARQIFPVALEAFDEVVRAAPDFAEGWNKRATLHYMMGTYAAAIADIEKTLALEPRHFGAQSGLGLVYLAMGDEVRALKAFDAALAVYPLMAGHDTHIRQLRDKLGARDI
jgi:tetratricopeptide (TPR) repeat protein